jgi:hypothetical protein
MFRNGLFALALLGLSSAPALAVPITVDQILYASGTNLAGLSGTVDMTLSGNTLTITLTNTSLDSAGAGAGILLTGIGFQLPTGVSISSGSATIAAGSTGVAFSGTGGTSVSQEWGYDNSPLNSGLYSTAGGYTTVVSSMESQTQTQFAAGSIAPPVNLNGPDFGLVSTLETDPLGTGVEAIRNSIVISLLLTGPVPSNLLALIQSGTVGLSFGSPNTATQVPEPSSLLLLSGAFFASAGYLRRKRKTA